MKILLAGPRYHTNLSGFIATLIDNGHEVIYHSLYQGNTENYQHLTPFYFKPCPFSIFISSFFVSRNVGSFYLFPSPFPTFTIL